MQKCNSALISGLLWKIITLVPLQILISPIFLNHYCRRKTLFNRNDIVFEMDFSSFSSAWEFFHTNSLPNFLKLPWVNLVTSASFRCKRKTKKTIFKIAPGTRLRLGSSWNQQDWVVNSLFSHLTIQLFYST